MTGIKKLSVREFIEKYTPMGEFKSDFELNSGVLKMMECYEDRINSIVYIPRQKLKSTVLCMLYVYTKVFEPSVEAKIIGPHDNEFINFRINSIISNLPTKYKLLAMKNEIMEKHEKYLFIDEFEFINDSALDILESGDFIMASSVINDNVSPKALNLINNGNIFNIIIKVNPEEFGDEYMKRMKISLNYDEDAYRREVLLERK